MDLSACGGTHVPDTGRIGQIAVAGWERFKGATRLTFVCGGRALRSHARLRDVVAGATRALSVAAADLPAAIERLQGEIKENARAAAVSEEVAVARASEIPGRRGDHWAVPRRLGVIPGWEAAALKTLATAIVSEPGFVVVLVEDGSPVPVGTDRRMSRSTLAPG